MCSTRQCRRHRTASGTTVDLASVDASMHGSRRCAHRVDARGSVVRRWGSVGAMRVIGGRLGGRRLRSVPRGARPTSDRVREALFSILGASAVEGARVLDVCAGSGALGLEALSRGAARVVAIDRSGEARRTILANARDLGLEDAIRVTGGEARTALSRLARGAASFDLVFFDPPYDAGIELEVLERLVEGELLAAGARVVVEGAKRHSLPPVPGLTADDERVYGDTVLTFLSRGDADASTREP
jgi:16S rRNA (guanine966-N2)-methyltransferase